MSSWHESMAQAVSDRQHAINGIKRWQSKLQAAEAVIADLSSQHRVNDTPPSPQIVQEQLAVLPEDLSPVFGITGNTSENVNA